MSEKILIRAPNHLGDCIMALPMINETREAYPGSSVTVLMPENLFDLFYPNPAIDELIKIPAEHVHGLIAVMKIKDLIADHRFDTGYILPPSFGAAAGFKLGGVKNRIGYIADGRRLLLTKPLPLPTPLNAAHRSELYFNLLRRGAGVDVEYVHPKLFLNDADTDRGVTLLRGFDLQADNEYAAVSFRAVAESRRWGEENYTDLVKRIVTGWGLKVVLLGTEADRKIGDRISKAAGAKEVLNLAGKTSIREVAAILSRARFFVGNDSGPAHLAAAVGIPIVVLSGADDPAATSPMTASKSLLYLKDLDCISCVKNKCPLRGEQYMQCMTGITVQMVAEEIQEILDKSP
ncbi:MAG: lipopolysaccharide heptosyltransferase II [Candidatus Zixiibacteriota bacterium]|nr:MAG: lipopolysaccharide heptosyltransferase II [candidate division Zixibacteria bacterium]